MVPITGQAGRAYWPFAFCPSLSGGPLKNSAQQLSASDCCSLCRNQVLEDVLINALIRCVLYLWEILDLNQ